MSLIQEANTVPRPVRKRNGQEVVESKVETITPQRARGWLEQRAENRQLRPHLVAQYAKAMAQGDWQMNGESIKFDTLGNLIDGQHRLHAIVEANVPVSTVVIRGLSTAVFDTLDTGMKRSLADILHLQGYAHPGVLSATLRMVHLWEQGAIGTQRGGGRVTNADLLRVLISYPWLPDDVSRGIRVGRALKTPQSTMAAAMFILEQIDADDAAYFFETLESGEFGQIKGIEDQPIRMLRDVLLKAREPRAVRFRSIFSTPYRFALIFKAWNAFREGRPLGVLSYHPGGRKPERFPTPR